MRVLRHSLVRNTLGLLASRALYGLFLLGASVLIARYLDVKALGVFGLAVVFGTYASALADCGVSQYLVPTLARAPRDQWRTIWANAWRFLKVSALPVVVPFAALAFAYHGDFRWALLATIPWWLLMRVSTAARSVFTVAEQLHYDALATFIEVVSGLAVLAALAATGASVQVVVLGLAAGAAAGFPVRLWGLRRIGVHGGRAVTPPLALARETLAFNGFNVLVALYMRVDVVLLSLLAAPVALGLYQAPVRLVTAALLLPEAIVPLLLGRAARDPDDRRTRHQQEALLGAAFLLAAGLFAAVAVAGDDLLSLLYGSRFGAAGLAFTLLAAAIPIRLLSYLNGNALTAYGHQGVRLGCMVVTAVFAVGAGIPAIAAYGYEGAAGVTLGSEAVLAIAYAIAAWRVIGSHAVLRPRAPVRGRRATASA